MFERIGLSLEFGEIELGGNLRKFGQLLEFRRNRGNRFPLLP